MPPGVLNVVNGIGDHGRPCPRLAPRRRRPGLHGIDGGRTPLPCAMRRDSNLKVGLARAGQVAEHRSPTRRDLDAAADAAAWAICFNSGQMCTAGLAGRSRAIADDLPGGCSTGPPRGVATRSTRRRGSPSRERGPPRARPRSRLAAQGRRPAAHRWRTHPARAAARTSSRTVPGSRRRGQRPGPSREVFGPVLAVLPFRDADDAVRLARDTSYGLAAAVWTSDLVTAHRVSWSVPAGTVWVNLLHEEGDPRCPSAACGPAATDGTSPATR